MLLCYVRSFMIHSLFKPFASPPAQKPSSESGRGSFDDDLDSHGSVKFEDTEFFKAISKWSISEALEGGFQVYADEAAVPAWTRGQMHLET